MIRSIAATLLLLAGLAGAAQAQPAPATQAPSPQAAAPEPSLPEAFIPQMAPWTGDFDGMVQRKTIRLLVPYNRTLFFLDRDRQYGIAADMARSFAAWLATRQPDVKVVLVPVRRDDMLRALQVGRGDIAASPLLVTPARQRELDFSAPWTTSLRHVLVTGPSAPALAGLDDMAGREIFLHRNSAAYGFMAAFNERLQARGLKPIAVRQADINLEDEDLLEMVQAGLLPWTIVDDHKAGIWARALGGLTVRSDVAVAEDGVLAWGVRKGSTGLQAILADFVRATPLPTAFPATVQERFFGPGAGLRPALAAPDRQRAETLLPVFRTAVSVSGFDPLMIMALGYQVSRLDQALRGPGGKVGIMQVTPAQARAVAIRGIDKDAASNIRAAALRLRSLVRTSVGDQLAIDERDSVLLAMVSDLAGPPQLARYRERARAIGLDPDTWFDNLEITAARESGRDLVRAIGHVHKYFIAFSLMAYATMPYSRMDQGQAPRASAPPGRAP